MLASKNLLEPKSGEPTVAPTLDMVMGCFYLTTMRTDVRGAYEPGGKSSGASTAPLRKPASPTTTAPCTCKP